MGSSHSYLDLQNLKTDDLFLNYYWIEDGFCLQTELNAKDIVKAYKAGGYAGSCSTTKYTQYDYKKSYHIPNEGTIKVSVW